MLIQRHKLDRMSDRCDVHRNVFVGASSQIIGRCERSTIDNEMAGRTTVLGGSSSHRVTTESREDRTTKGSRTDSDWSAD
ncbi:hypothetical protein LSAT2_012449, partial [Lamellibrachia satsuma]